MAQTPRSSGVFSLGALSADGAGTTTPWTPADITSATVVGWFDGENVNGGTSGNSGATSWVNQIIGQNDLDFISGSTAPTIGTDNVRTLNSSYLLETGTASFQQTADFRVFVAATLQGGTGSSNYYPLISTVSGTSDVGTLIFWRGSNTFASYPNYNNWGNRDNHTPSHRSNFANNPAVYDFTASQSSPWQFSFDGGSNTRVGPATYQTQIAAGKSLCFGYQYTHNRRCDAEYYQIVVVHGTLSSTDEEKLYGFLAHKAGSQSYLPNTNSYQSAAPTNTTAGPTRPARRWGGMTGRSLVETTTSAAPLWTPDNVTNTAAPAIWLDASTGLTTNKGSLSTTVTLGAGAWSSSGTQNGLTTAINSAASTVVPISFTGTAVASIAMLYRWDSAGASRAYGTTFSGSAVSDYVFMGGNGSAVLHSYGNADSHNWDHVREDGVEYSTSHTTTTAWGTRTTDWVLHVFVLYGTKTATINRWGYERTYANRHFTGEIAEVMAFPGLLSQSECEQVEGYLAHKWGLASLLPSAHSYKSAAPTSGTGSTSTNVLTTGVLSLPELLQERYGAPWDGTGISYLVLAGGGSGNYTASHGGGGGGAGGYRTNWVGAGSEKTGGDSTINSTSAPAVVITSGTAYTIQVGAGGAQTGTATGNNGTNSVFSTIIADGGGRGGARQNAGEPGGSGGGAGRDAQASGGNGTAYQGSNGGSSPSTSFSPGGGGGGAGAVGYDATASTNNSTSTERGGNGGNGLASSITGASVTRAGGGAGHNYSATIATGGSGGGADGAISGTAATLPTPHTGSGGGGGGPASASEGAAGTVILRIPRGYSQAQMEDDLSSTTGVTFSTVGGDLVAVFETNATSGSPAGTTTTWTWTPTF